jgi:hypothetical protein
LPIVFFRAVWRVAAFRVVLARGIRPWAET